MGKRKANHIISGMNVDPPKGKELAIMKSSQMNL